MSLSADNMRRLMAYADGELDGSERAEIESLLEKDDDAARFVEQIADLGTLLSAGHEARRAGTLASFDVADAVMDRVKAAGPPAKPDDANGAKPSERKVVSLGDARAARAQRLRIGAAVVAVLAIAASVFLVNRPKETPLAQGTTQAAGGNAAHPGPALVPQPRAPESMAAHVAEQASTVAAAVDDGPGVEVQAVESSGHPVSVFYLPSKNQLSTSVVVWVDETGGK